MGFVDGVAVVVLGGLLSGLFTAPMKLVKGWRFENIWLVYAIYAMVFFPWMLVGYSVPNLFDVYGAASSKALALCLVFGFLWGAGSSLFGIGTSLVGNSLGFALILGMTSAIGAALPLLVLHPEEAGAKQGIFTWIGLVIVAAGLACLAYSGARKEREIKERALLTNVDINGRESGASAKPFRLGLFVCILSGIFSPMLNLALAFGSDIGDQAKAKGVSDLNANNTIWALAVAAGFLVNCSYCCYQLFANNTWALYGAVSTGQRMKNTLLGLLMGVLWCGGNTLYGIGVSLVGDLGAVIGWPMFLSAMIVAANLFAAFTGASRFF